MLKGLIVKIQELPIGKKEIYEEKVLRVVNLKFPIIAKKLIEIEK